MKIAAFTDGTAAGPAKQHMRSKTHQMNTDEVARTILYQLGGHRFVQMTGAKNLVGSDDSLSFKIGSNAEKITHVRVTLTPAGDYTLEFLKIRGTMIKPLHTAEHVYADNLPRVFERHTGMGVSL